RSGGVNVKIEELDRGADQAGEENLGGPVGSATSTGGGSFGFADGLMHDGSSNCRSPGTLAQNRCCVLANQEIAMKIHPLQLDPGLVRALQPIPTAPLTRVLLKRGLRNVGLRGTRPLHSSPSGLAGRAFTLRFVSAREDLATPASWGSPISTRAAIEEMPSGCIAVVGALGCT